MFNSAQSGYDSCDFIALPSKSDFSYEAFGLQKNSPYLEFINYFILKLMENGAVEKILLKYKTPSQVCPDYNGEPIGYINCGSAFIILAIGFIICLSIMALESFSNKYGYMNQVLKTCSKSISENDCKVGFFTSKAKLSIMLLN